MEMSILSRIKKLPDFDDSYSNTKKYLTIEKSPSKMYECLNCLLFNNHEF